MAMSAKFVDCKSCTLSITLPTVQNSGDLTHSAGEHYGNDKMFGQ